jgi:hypothetical protein
VCEISAISQFEFEIRQQKAPAQASLRSLRKFGACRGFEFHPFEIESVLRAQRLPNL